MNKVFIEKVVDIQVEQDTMKILCECSNDEYKVVEIQIDFDGIRISDERYIGPDLLVKEKCNIIIPVKMNDDNCMLNIKEWK